MYGAKLQFFRFQHQIRVLGALDCFFTVGTPLGVIWGGIWNNFWVPSDVLCGGFLQSNRVWAPCKFHAHPKPHALVLPILTVPLNVRICILLAQVLHHVNMSLWFSCSGALYCVVCGVCVCTGVWHVWCVVCVVWCVCVCVCVCVWVSVCAYVLCG